MNRRDFLGTMAAGLTPLLAQTGEPLGSSDSGANGRRVLSMNRGWLYQAQYVAEAVKPGFDESAMEKVTLPHTNRLLPWHSFDERSYQFVSVYRRHFRVPGDLRDKRVFLDFEGVMTASTVTVNGHEFAEYRGGYTPFTFDITNYLQTGGDNLLAVKVDSTERADIPPFGDNIDYLTFGGIYREVSLRIVPKSYLENVSAMPQDVLTPQIEDRRRQHPPDREA